MTENSRRWGAGTVGGCFERGGACRPYIMKLPCVMLFRACVCANVSVCWSASSCKRLSLSLQGAVGGCIIDRAHLFGKNRKDTAAWM